MPKNHAGHPPVEADHASQQSEQPELSPRYQQIYDSVGKSEWWLSESMARQDSGMDGNSGAFPEESERENTVSDDGGLTS